MNDLIQKIVDYGIMVVISALFVWIIIKGINLLDKYLNSKIKIENKYTKITEISYSDLKSHIFFDKLYQYETYNIPYADFGCGGRNYFFKKMILIKIKYWKMAGYEMIEFLNSSNKELIDYNRFHDNIREIMQSCVNNYEYQWKKDTDIPDKAIKNFKEWQKSTLQLSNELVNGIAKSSIIKGWERKLYEIFDMYLFMLSATIVNCERVMKEFNGEICVYCIKKFPQETDFKFKRCKKRI